MSVVTVNIGRQSVPVGVSTYQFGDQSMSATVAAGVASVAASAAAAASANPNYVPCDVVVVGSYWRMTPKAGYSVVSTGADQVFFGIAPAASPASLGVRVVGINPNDERAVRRADGTTNVTTGDILIGGFFSVKYHTTGSRAGLFQLIDGLASSGSATGGGLLTKMVQTARTNNTVTMAAATGYSLPNNTGDDTIMVYEVGADGVAESSWLIMVTGINGSDPFALKYRDGTVVAPTTPKAGDRLFLERPGGTGAFYTLFEHWKADTAKGTESGSTSTPYESRRTFYTARNIQIAAIG